MTALNKTHIQFAGLAALSGLAWYLLYLIGYTFGQAISHITPDGKIPILDAGMITAFLLSFQHTVGAMRSIWESQERTSLTERLSDSLPGGQPTTKTAAKGARAAADGADKVAERIEEKAEQV